MKRILVLTRQEIDDIVSKHLIKKGLLPAEGKKSVSICVLSSHDSYKHLAQKQGTPWGEWPALEYTWEEKIKE